MKTSSLEYTSFLIRLWREPPGSSELSCTDREWLVQVEHIPGGEKEYFASLEELFAFIRAQLPGAHVGKGAREQGGGGAKEQRSRGVRETRRGGDGVTRGILTRL